MFGKVLSRYFDSLDAPSSRTYRGAGGLARRHCPLVGGVQAYREV
jgi:hypothetical protein